jgi:ribose transport system permease protein
MFGGLGGVGRTVVGVLIYESIFAGLIYLHYDAFWQQVATGAVLVVAVWLDAIQRKTQSAVTTAAISTPKNRRMWNLRRPI